MKSRALDEASAASQRDNNHDTTESNTPSEKSTQQMAPARPSLNRLNTPFGQRTDGTESAARAVEGMVEGVKAVVHEAVVWTERKAEELAHAEDRTGPYDSPATAAGGVSDLDVIATGVLPATAQAQQDGKDQQKDGENRLDS